MAALLLLGAAACGGDDDGDDTADDTTTTTEAADEETTTTTVVDDEETTTTTVTDEGNLAIEQFAQSTLITLEELALEGFTDLGYTPSPGPNQCGFDIDATHPAAVVVGTDLGSDTLRFLQEVRVYETPAAAETAFQAGLEGTQCTPEDGTQIAAPIDVTTDVDAQQAVLISATRDDLNVVVVAALLSDAVVSFNFAGAPADIEAAGAPHPVEVAAFGIGKIKAAMEQLQGEN
jgi:hypothetical protein